MYVHVQQYWGYTLSFLGLYVFFSLWLGHPARAVLWTLQGRCGIGGGYRPLRSTNSSKYPYLLKE